MDLKECILVFSDKMIIESQQFLGVDLAEIDLHGHSVHTYMILKSFLVYPQNGLRNPYELRALATKIGGNAYKTLKQHYPMLELPIFADRGGKPFYHDRDSQPRNFDLTIQLNHVLTFHLVPENEIITYEKCNVTLTNNTATITSPDATVVIITFENSYVVAATIKKYTEAWIISKETTPQ